MASKQPDGTFIIAAGEVGAYTVCPQSWKLKWIDREKGVPGGGEQLLGIELHKHWSQLFEESLLFGKWSRYLAALLCTAVILFLCLKRPSDSLARLFDLSVRGTIFELAIIVCAALIVIRGLLSAARGRSASTGLAAGEATISVDGSPTLPAREYVSRAQGLAGKPDALIVENGCSVPVERKPLAKKLRDRYVAQILVYMRLVEEFEGQKPPYGYLLLGPKCRRIKIQNSPERQAWLDSLLAEMRAVLEGGEARAVTHPVKCSKCNVRHRCLAWAGDAQHTVSPTLSNDE